MTRVLSYTLSPAAAVEHLRGDITDCHRGHPDVLQLTIRDRDGDEWHLTTLDASWWPTDPSELAGRRIVDGALDVSGVLRFALADGGSFVVRPEPRAGNDDPATWEILTPDDLSLEFGPGQQWRVARSDVPMGRP